MNKYERYINLYHDIKYKKYYALKRCRNLAVKRYLNTTTVGGTNITLTERR